MANREVRMGDRGRKTENGFYFLLSTFPFPLSLSFQRWTRFLALSVLLIAVLVPPAGADGEALSRRLDPTLRRLVRKMRSEPRSFTGVIRPEERLPDQVKVTIRAQRDVSAEVVALGGRVNTVIGGRPAILTAHLPIEGVEVLARNRSIISVSASAPLSTSLDESVIDIKAHEVWKLEDETLPVTGQGVLVGIVDTGIDLSHPDFEGADGNPRVVSIWDQTDSGAPPAGLDYGVEWSRRQIESGIATEADTDGHGTHMAGIAAGAGTRYRGVAPDAELVVVKALLDTASIIDAWNYIVDKAEDMGRPVVINNSFGGHSGAHDGTADYERALDALSGPGVIFVTAAGNEGQSAMHAAGRVPVEGTVTLPISFFEGYGRAYAEVNVWYEGADSFSVSLAAPTGQTFGPVTRGAFRMFGDSAGTEITVDAVSAPWPANGDNWIRIWLDAAGGETIGGDWSITLDGDRVRDGRFDAWLSYDPYDRVFFGYYIDWSSTIREPATALQAVSVGGYVTKDCWTAGDGFGYCDPYADGGLYPHTSRGPTRDGRPRPDVTAPGARVFAPRSADALVEHPWQVAPDDRYAGRVGTSVSTAHATGVVALMLQVDPTLDPTTVRSALRRSARQDRFTEAGSDRQWGAGKLNALAAVRTVQQRGMNRQYVPLLMRNRHWQPAPTPTLTPNPTPTATHIPPPGPDPSPVAGGR